MTPCSFTSPPEPCKPRRVGRRVSDGVLNIPVSQIILNEPRIRALVGEGKAARMTQHVRVGLHGQSCALAIGADRQPGRLTAERASAFTEKERIRLRFHSRPRNQPSLFRRPRVPVRFSDSKHRRGRSVR